MECSAKEIISRSTPKQNATGELIVLKGVIKHTFGTREGNKIVKKVNQTLGPICAKANNNNIQSIYKIIEAFKEVVKQKNETRIDYELMCLRISNV